MDSLGCVSLIITVLVAQMVNTTEDQILSEVKFKNSTINCFGIDITICAIVTLQDMRSQ